VVPDRVRMNIPDRARLADAELRSFLNGLFPHGLAGPDISAEVAPEGWERSPLLACFHPSAEQLFREEVCILHELEALRREFHSGDDVKADAAPAAKPEPTLEDVRRRWRRPRVCPH